MVRDIIIKYKTYCESKGWTQEQSAQAIGCSRPHLSHIFSETRNPSIKLLEKMEEVMKNKGVE